MKKRISLGVFVLAALALAFAATAGPNLAGTGGTAGGCDGASTFCWTSPGSVTANDGVFASVALGAGANSNELQGRISALPFPQAPPSTALPWRFSKRPSRALATRPTLT